MLQSLLARPPLLVLFADIRKMVMSEFYLDQVEVYNSQVFMCPLLRIAR